MSFENQLKHEIGQLRWRNGKPLHWRDRRLLEEMLLGSATLMKWVIDPHYTVGIGVVPACKATGTKRHLEVRWVLYRRLFDQNAQSVDADASQN